MSNTKVMDVEKTKWWVPVAGDKDGKVKIDGHIWNPTLQQWDPEEKPDEDTPRRLLETLIEHTKETNNLLLQMLDKM